MRTKHSCNTDRIKRNGGSLAKIRRLEAYYETKHWRELSRKVRKERGRCERCGGTEKLQVHHLRYRWYREKQSDLRVLCEKCHLETIHRQLGWEKMLDFNHIQNRGDRLNYLIDVSLENNREKPRDYLGGSRLGHECARALQYEFYGTPKDKDFSGQVLRIFQVGHAVEDLAAGWLRGAGFDLRTVDKEGNQFGFVTGKGKIRGHIDGVVTSGPEELGPYPRLWECKSASNKKWKEFQKNKVKKANYTYYVQVLIYQMYMGLTDNAALWTCVNKDDSQLYHEDIAFDPSIAQDASDRAVRIIQACMAGELLPREYPSADFFQCKFCSWAERCWHD